MDIQGTIAELRAACPGAPADFLMAQLEAAADVPTAKAAWLDQREKQLGEREKQLAGGKAEGRSFGVKPILERAGGGRAETSADTSDFAELLRAEMDKGTPRCEAVRRVGKRHPEAHQAFVREHNADTARVQTLIGERFTL